MENNCKWHFGNEGGIDIGPNDPVHQTFKGSPYYSIVREAIQNSLDAVYDDKSPVKVTFQYFELDRLKHPNFFQLENHIKHCLEYYQNNNDAKRLFGDMLYYLNGNEKGMKKRKVSCLRISDYNTEGMPYAPDDTESPFYAFLRATGVSAKMISGTGGSFGFGKGAYFALSPIKTVIVSSRDENNVYFEGATRLTTHKNGNDEKLTAYGFYDNNNGNPTQVESKIPEIFRRNEIGTDISVVGLWKEEHRNLLMIKSVLNNFWLAIHDKKLVVTINDTTISRENLEQIIDDFFPNEFESGNAIEIESWNPKPYYKAVKYADANEQFKVFSEKLETLGKVKLYIYLEKGLPNRTSFFRKPKMVVFKRTNRKINGYAAVFICENNDGNEILRMMENPAHNEWRKENYPKHEGRIDKIARKAENELSNFVNAQLEKLSKVNTSKKVAFLGLEDYLSIPEDLLEKDDNSDLSGENESSDFGDSTDDLSEDETGMQTTDDEPISIKPTIQQRTEIKEEDNTELSDKGEEKITVGGVNEGGGGDEPSPDEGDTGNKGSRSDEENIGRVLFKVKLKVAAQREDGTLYHNLLLNSDRDVAKAELELFVGSDNDQDDGMEIISTDNGEYEKNRLKKVALSSGKNQIKIRFADNLKHSVKLKAYEIQ
ncbi:MAG: hypothetical protein WD577_09485 [Bacteroidales bacterium]